MITKLEAISSMPSVGTGRIEPKRYQCTLHARLPDRALACSESAYIATVGTDCPHRPRILKVGSYGRTAVESVDNFAERVKAVQDGQTEWPADFSKEERDFQCLLGDTDTKTDDLGYISYPGGKETVILPTLRDRSFTIRQRSTALYHRMCDNEWCKIRIVQILDPSSSVSGLQVLAPPNNQGDIAFPVSKTTNFPTEAWIRDLAQAYAVHMAWLLRHRGFRNHLKANGAQATGIHAHGTRTSCTRTNSAETDSAHTDSAHTNDVHTNGAHMNDARSTHTNTNGARTPESYTDDPYANEHHTDEHHTDEHHADDHDTDDLHTDGPHTLSLQRDGLHTGDPHTEDSHTEDPHTEDSHTEDPHTEDPLMGDPPDDDEISGSHPNGPHTDGTRLNGTPADDTDTDCDFTNRRRTSGYKRGRGNE